MGPCTRQPYMFWRDIKLFNTAKLFWIPSQLVIHPFLKYHIVTDVLRYLRILSETSNIVRLTCSTQMFVTIIDILMFCERKETWWILERIFIWIHFRLNFYGQSRSVSHIPSFNVGWHTLRASSGFLTTSISCDSRNPRFTVTVSDWLATGRIRRL